MTVHKSFPGFDDGKASDALRTIGEVTKALGIRQHVLRYWEEQFPMLKPVKRSGGRRYYRLEDVHLLAKIDQLVHREGYTLRGARLAIESGAMQNDPPQPIETPAAGPSADFVARLTTIRSALAAALAAS